MTQIGLSPRLPVERSLLVASLANLVWINASEVFRYFAFVMPMLREAFPGIANVAPMSVPVFLIWGLWDTILVAGVTGLAFALLDRFGPTLRNALLAGTALWMSIFVILWLGLYNMNLATARIALTALPLAWIEMAVAALIVRWALLRA